ncbi:MAG: 1-hydroxycarotenoid 3,4-desaturase CrtD [Pseudomonadota bacterium]
MRALPSLTADHVVVIGAGIAGLAAAVRLRAAGLRVTLLERHSHLGGKIRTVPSAAGPINAGPTVMTLRSVFDELFAAAGARLEDHVELIAHDILARHAWADRSMLDLHANMADSIAAVDAFAGARAADQFRQFCARTQQLFQAFEAPIMQAAVPRPMDLTRHVLRQPRLIPAMAPLSSLQSMLKRSFDDQRLQQLFGRYATYVGGAPQWSPAILSLIWQAEAQGVWSPRGGMHALAEAVGQLAQRLGVEVKTDAHVARLSVQSGRVAGVELAEGPRVTCDAVVYAGDPRALAAGSLGHAFRAVAPQTMRLPRSHSARVHSFAAAADGLPLAHHTVLFGDVPNAEFRALRTGTMPTDATVYICALDRAEGAPTPGTLERFEIISNAPATEAALQPEELDQWHHRTMQRMAQSFDLRFTPTPSPQTVTTPQAFAAMFPDSLGALYGQSPHGLMSAFQRPTARTPIPGLYLAGGGTHPGAGVPMAARSGQHAAEAILNDRTSTLRSGQTAMRGGMSTA